MTDTLYDIGADMRALEDILFEAGGEINDEALESEIDRWLDDNNTRLEIKLDKYGMLIRNREAIAEQRSKEAKRLEALAKTDHNLVARLKGRLYGFFKVHKKDKVETEKFKFWLQKNGGATPVVLSAKVQTDLELLPNRFIKYTPSIDTAKLREALESPDEKDRKDLKGLAWLGEPGDHLRIK